MKVVARLLLAWLAAAVAGLLLCGLIDARALQQAETDRNDAAILALAAEEADVFADGVRPDVAPDAAPGLGATLAHLGSLSPAVLDVWLMLPDGRVAASLHGRSPVQPTTATQPNAPHFLQIEVHDWTGAERATLLLLVGPPESGTFGGGWRWAGLPLAAIVSLLVGLLILQQPGLWPLAHSRRRFVAIPVLGFLAVQAVSLIVAAEHFRRADAASAQGVVRLLGQRLQSSPDAANGATVVSAETRLARMARAVPEIDSIVIAGADGLVQSAGAGDAETSAGRIRTSSTQEFLVAPDADQTELGFRHAFVHLDSWQFARRAAMYATGSLLVSAAIALVLGEWVSSLWPSAARLRRLAAISAEAALLEERERPRRLAGRFLLIQGAAIAAPWPAFAPILQNWTETRGEASLALAVCLSAEALAFAAGTLGGAQLANRQGGRLAAGLGLLSALAGLFFLASAGGSTMFGLAWALIGFGDGLARCGLVDLAEDRGTSAVAGNEAALLRTMLIAHILGTGVGGSIGMVLGPGGALVSTALALIGLFVAVRLGPADARGPLRQLIHSAPSVSALARDFGRAMRNLSFFVVVALAGVEALVLRVLLPLGANAEEQPAFTLAACLIAMDLIALGIHALVRRFGRARMPVPLWPVLAAAKAAQALALAAFACGIAPASRFAWVLLAAAVLAPLLLRLATARRRSTA